MEFHIKLYKKFNKKKILMLNIFARYVKQFYLWNIKKEVVTISNNFNTIKAVNRVDHALNIIEQNGRIQQNINFVKKKFRDS